jgi:hypothetical protein
VIPHSFDANDSRIQRGGDFSTGEDFFPTAKTPSTGSTRRTRMMTISLHTRIIGLPGRI